MEIKNPILINSLEEIKKELIEKEKIEYIRELSLEDQTIAYLISLYKATKNLIG